MLSPVYNEFLTRIRTKHVRVTKSCSKTQGELLSDIREARPLVAPQAWFWREPIRKFLREMLRSRSWAASVADPAPGRLVVQAVFRVRPAIPRFDRLSAVIAALPIAVIIVLILASFWTSLQPDSGTPARSISLQGYRDLFGSGTIGSVIINTLVFSGVSVVVSGGLGGAIAWLVARTDIPGKALIRTLMMLNVVLPGYVVAMGWLFLFAERIGSINTWLAAVFPFGSIRISVSNPVGMGVVEGFSLASLFFIMLVDAFNSADPSLEEAAQVHGTGKTSLALRIVLPLALPSILAAGFYVAIVAVAAFDIPAIIGLSGRTLTLSTYLYLLIQPGAGMLPAYNTAAAAGVLIMFMTIVPMILYQRLLRRSSEYAVISGKAYRPRAIQLSRWTTGSIWLFLGLYFAFAQVLPLLNTLWVSLQPYTRPISISGFSDISVESYTALPWPLIGLGFRNSAFLMLASPTLAVFFGIFIAWTVVRSQLSWRGIYDYFAFLPHMVPSVVFALSMLLITLFVVPGLGLYGTIYAILIAYVVTHISFATRTFNGALLAISTELADAASVHGVGPCQRLLSIVLPLMLPTVASTWLWLALLSYRELTIASFLATRENITLSSVIWSNWTSGSSSQSASMTIIGVLIMGPMIGVYWWVNRQFMTGGFEER